MKLPRFKKFNHTVRETGSRMWLHYRIKLGSGAVALAAGTGDHIAVRRINNTAYVLNVNRHIPYVGLELVELNPSAAAVVASTFMQGSEQVEAALGTDWDGLSDDEMIGILEEYL
jgi:hypothetical protein